MKYIGYGLFMLFAWLIPGLSLANPNSIAFAHNLQKDAQVAQHKGVPILIIFTSPDCSYCEVVMKNYLIPMQRNREYANKVIMRRVEINSIQPMTDFAGKTTTPQQYAAQFKIKITPVIIVYTPDGMPAADPLVGLGPADYYGGNLDSVIDAGLAKMHAAGH